MAFIRLRQVCRSCFDPVQCCTVAAEIWRAARERQLPAAGKAGRWWRALGRAALPPAAPAASAGATWKPPGCSCWVFCCRFVFASFHRLRQEESFGPVLLRKFACVCPTHTREAERVLGPRLVRSHAQAILSSLRAQCLQARRQLPSIGAGGGSLRLHGVRGSCGCLPPFAGLQRWPGQQRGEVMKGGRSAVATQFQRQALPGVGVRGGPSHGLGEAQEQPNVLHAGAVQS